MPIRPGGGGGGGGGSVTQIAADITPNGGTPSNFGDGQTIAGGMLDGWNVQDPAPGPVLDSMTDDGTELTIGVNNSNQKVGTDVNQILTGMLIAYPNLFVGDFHVQFHVACTGTGNSTNEFFLGCGDGNTASECHGVILSLNANSGANWQRFGYLNTNSSHTAFSDFTNLAMATHRWIAVQRVGDLITWRDGGTAATPSYSDLDSERQDVAGGRCRIYFSAITGLVGATVFSLKRIIIDGFEYKADLSS